MERPSMIQDDEYTQALTDLGLTLLQAKTYLALATLGKADAKQLQRLQTWLDKTSTE